MAKIFSGCLNCHYFKEGRCGIRNTPIADPQWSYCANIYLNDGLYEKAPLPAATVIKEGSIYSLYKSGKQYTRVPWLENSPVTLINEYRPCEICSKLDFITKTIKWRGDSYDFYSFNHYFEWRNKMIKEFGANDTPMDFSNMSYFLDVKPRKLMRQIGNEEFDHVEEPPDGTKASTGWTKWAQWLLFITLIRVVANLFSHHHS